MVVEVVIYKTCRIWPQSSSGSDWWKQNVHNHMSSIALRVPIQLPVPHGDRPGLSRSHRVSWPWAEIFSLPATSSTRPEPVFA